MKTPYDFAHEASIGPMRVIVETKQEAYLRCYTERVVPLQAALRALVAAGRAVEDEHYMEPISMGRIYGGGRGRRIKEFTETEQRMLTAAEAAEKLLEVE